MASQTNVHQVCVNGILNRMKLPLTCRKRIDQYCSYGPPLWHRQTTLPTHRSSTWSRGKLYCIEELRLFLVPTNYPTVNYLNLEEFTFGYPTPRYPTDDFKPPVSIRPGNRLQSVFNLGSNDHLNPLVEDSEDKVLRHHFGDYRLKFLEVMNEVRDWWCPSVMQYEYDLASLLSLRQRWDAAKYMKLLQTCRDPNWRDHRYKKIKIDELGFKILLDILIASCDDSLFIVEVMKERSLSTEEYIFFRCHLQLANLKESLFKVVFDRKIGYGHLLWSALLYRDIELMKIGLEVQCWLEYSDPVTSIVECIRAIYLRYPLWPESTVWPRRKDQVCNKSFNCVEFYSVFTYLTIYYTTFITPKHAMPILDIDNDVQCFQLIWRSIPTPYLPIEDMERVVDSSRMRRLFEHTRNHVEHHAIWETVAMLFEDDFPTEFKPRSLQHLSRCAVRRRFRSPEHIAALPIPGLTKRYLLLEF